jgi:AraC-like DNA-binding protein
VGAHPPLTYLTRWRMTLAADLLIERRTATVAEIANTVGYSDPFGFSAAFKRIRGINPSDFRRQGLRVADRIDAIS